jgi:thiamine biosynthesis lipoprotein
MTAATRIYRHSSAGMIAIGAQSATVVGPLGWLCDAMATAVMVGGQDSVAWFGQEELLGYQVFGVNRHEDTAWEIGGTSF